MQRIAQEAQGKHSINDRIISAYIQEQNSISDEQSGTGAADENLNAMALTVWILLFY